MYTYMFDRGIDFVTISTIFLLYFRTVLMVLLLPIKVAQNNETDILLKNNQKYFHLRHMN